MLTRTFSPGYWLRMAVLWCAVLPTPAAVSQEQWAFKFIETPARVPLTEVRGIAEDAAGNIWVSTWGNGVARLGPTDWHWVNEQGGLPGNWTRGICVGADDTVWIATADGLGIYRNNRLTSFTTNDLAVLPSNDLDTVNATDAGDILLGTREGSVVLIRGGSADGAAALSEPGRWEVLRAPSRNQEYRLASLHSEAGGDLWLSYRGGALDRYDGTSLEPAPGPGPGMGLLLAGRAAEPAWAGQWYGHRFFQWSDSEWAEAGSLPEVFNVLYAGRDGHYYAGTEAGLFRLGDGTAEQVPLGDSVGDPHINAILHASDGALWLGTQEGLVRGAQRSWQHFMHNIEGETLNGIVPDPDGEGLLATDAGNGVSRFDGRRWRRKIQLESEEPLGYYHTTPGSPYLWALGQTDLYQFSLDDGSQVSRTTPPDADADRRLFHTQSGELWFLARDGVRALVDGVWEPRPAVADYERRQVFSIHETEPGTFYVGLLDGIECWRDGNVTYYGPDAGVSDRDSTHTICPMGDGTIWFGTFGSGIYVFDGTNFRRISVSDGLAHHSISNILEAADGTVWASYRRVGLGSFRDGRWLNYGAENGLPNASVLGLVKHSGQLWLQTRGAGIFRYRRDTSPPETRVEGATFEIPSDGIGVFTFSATDAWQVTPAHALLYSWRVLERPGGRVREPWSPFLTRATFITPALEPGEYTIEARASDDARNVDPTPASIDFRVYPPIWRQPGVYMPALVLGALFLLAAGLRVHANQNLRRSKAALTQSNRQLMREIRERLLAEQRLNEHFEQLEEIVRARTGDLEAAQRALVQQERLAMLGKVTASVSHELRNPLGTLRSTVFTIGRRVRGHDLGLEDAILRAERSIKRCDRIIEEFLDFTRTVSMERENIQMDRWLESALAEMELPEDVACHFTYESNLTLSVDPERLRRAVVNVVNNAVQAMAEKAEGIKRLRIKSRVRDGRFEIVVKDSGPGFPDETKARIFEPLYSTKGFGVGLGMSIVKDIMEKHEGGIEYHSVVGKGTTAVLWIPLGRTPGDP